MLIMDLKFDKEGIYLTPCKSVFLRQSLLKLWAKTTAEVVNILQQTENVNKPPASKVCCEAPRHLAQILDRTLKF